MTQTFRYGTEFYQSKNFNKPDNHYPEKVNNYSIYAEDALNFSSLTITPGIRYTHHELKSYDGRAGNVKSYTYKFSEFTPALALDYGSLKDYTRLQATRGSLEDLTLWSRCMQVEVVGAGH